VRAIPKYLGRSTGYGPANRLACVNGERMETILDIFTTLNCAIDAGAMTQEALTVALAVIVSRAHEELKRGALPLDWKQRLTREAEGLAQHWKAYCAAQIQP